MTMLRVGGRPPALSVKNLSRVVSKYFNFGNVQENSVKKLPAYEGRNYCFRGQCPEELGSEFIIKLMNPVCSPFEEVRGMVDFVGHIHSCRFPYSTPHALASKEGPHVIQLSHNELMGDATAVNQNKNIIYPLSVFSYVKGEVFDHVEKKFLTSTLLNEVGRMIGTFHKDISVINNVE